MSHIRVSIRIDAEPAVVWAEVRLVDRHVMWMADAVSITFHGQKRAGVGTVFDCDTKIGPIRLTDRMEITQWREGAAIGVRHSGLVTGIGEFTLTESPPDGTVFTWEEDLTFPLWMGGRLAGMLGRPVLERIWRKNLKTLKALVESCG